MDDLAMRKMMILALEAKGQLTAEALAQILGER
jgi:hypothetical protein